MELEIISEIKIKNIDDMISASKKTYEKYGCAAVEMESFALFHNANVLGKKAACLLTISDNLVTHAETTSEERQNSFNEMIKLALESVTE